LRTIRLWLWPRSVGKCTPLKCFLLIIPWRQGRSNDLRPAKLWGRTGYPYLCLHKHKFHCAEHY
jgi:hypothetical protein